MGDIKFHDVVDTPSGTGVVQGWLKERQADGTYQPTRVIVSHAKNVKVARERLISVDAIRGIWTLAAYPASELTVRR